MTALVLVAAVGRRAELIRQCLLSTGPDKKQIEDNFGQLDKNNGTQTDHDNSGQDSTFIKDLPTDNLF